MEKEQEERIRELAYSIWLSAGRPYWVALDYWLMAEKMVIELMIAANSGVIAPRPSADADGDGPDRWEPERLAAE